MSVDSALVEAYLAHMQFALDNFDLPYAESLLVHVRELLVSPVAPQPFPLPMQICTGMSLNAGTRRKGTPNQDFVFATTGCADHISEPYGLFVVADGMGGHTQGNVASELATQTMIDALFPLVQGGHVQGSEVGSLLIDAVNQACAAIYERNRSLATRLEHMGTTVTAAVVLGSHAWIANVGDSRTYLYRPGVGLRAITRDHSVVATLVANGTITPDEVYTHPKRNQILRCLGAAPTVEVDVFPEVLQDGDLLLCCSDGVWEMVRDPQIEQILASSWLSAQQKAERLTYAAQQAGGHDNIGLVVAHFQMDVTTMQTVVNASSPYAAARS